MFKSVAQFFFDVDRQERTKTILLALAFFFIIAGYTLVKELNDSIFVHIVGREYNPWARILSMICLVPAILVFSKCVDLVRKHQLIYIYSTIYGVGCLVFALFLGNSEIGFLNAQPSPYRLFGWILYIFIEGYSPFMVSLFWSFANSITSPNAAKKNYTLIVAASKIGGMFSAALAILFIRASYFGNDSLIADTNNHQILLASAGVFSLLVPLMIWLLVKLVPQRELHGYEAVYILEHKKQYRKPGMISGLTALLKQPYLLGIFGLVFFWEVTNVVLQYQRIIIGAHTSNSISQFTSFLMEQVFLMHAMGLIIVLFGTRAFIALLGERRSLLLVPIVTGVLLMYCAIASTPTVMLLVYALLRSLNYAFTTPLRESLYIPTTSELRFKSKSWIDAFGAKIAKGFGAFYIIAALFISESMIWLSHSLFFTAIIGLWITTAHWLGRRYERALKDDEVIGS